MPQVPRGKKAEKVIKYLTEVMENEHRRPADRDRAAQMLFRIFEHQDKHLDKAAARRARLAMQGQTPEAIDHLTLPEAEAEEDQRIKAAFDGVMRKPAVET